MNTKTFLINTFCLMMALSILATCSSQKESNELTFETVQITQDQLQPFVSFEQDSILGPVDIKFLPNGNYVVLDNPSSSIFIFDEDGERIANIGRRGKGPGEFVWPEGVEVTKKYILVGDPEQSLWQKFDHRGNFVDPVILENGNSIIFDMKILAENEFLIPADGKQGSLVEHRNIQTNRSFYFGEAMGDSKKTKGLQESSAQAGSGDIPDRLKNGVLLAHDSSNYYAFLKAYGRIQKYTHSGELLWDKELKLPFMEKVYDAYVERNKELKGAVLISLSYANDMEVHSGNIFLSMRTTERNKNTIIQLNEEGNIQKKYEINQGQGPIHSFTVSPSGDTLYLVANGEILFLNLTD